MLDQLNWFFLFRKSENSRQKEYMSYIIISKYIQTLMEELVAGLMESSSENEFKLSRMCQIDWKLPEGLKV